MTRPPRGSLRASAELLSPAFHLHSLTRLRLTYDRENNKTQPRGTIDLHGLYVQESIEFTEKAIQVRACPSSPALPSLLP